MRLRVIAPLVQSLESLAQAVPEPGDPAMEKLVADEVEALSSRARAAETRLGQQRTKHLGAVEKYIFLDWAKVLAATPTRLEQTPGIGGRMMLVERNKAAVKLLQKAVANARGALTSTIGDASPGKNSVDPWNLASAISMLQGAARDAVRQDFDINTGLRTSSAEHAVKMFYQAEGAAAILANITPLALAPAPKPDVLPPLATMPALHNDSIQGGFDPREMGGR